LDFSLYCNKRTVPSQVWYNTVMPKPRLPAKEVSRIRKLRETGHTLSEIRTIVKRANGTIWKYTQGVSILPRYRKIWKIKRGGSKAKSTRDWEEAKARALPIIQKLGFKERMLVLSCLYWGEGNKAELNLINSDPILVRTFLRCLKDLGIRNEELKVSLRLFPRISKKKAISFWSRTLSLPRGTIRKIDVVSGKKKGKLKYGMCRVRVKKGGKYFKLIISMINLIKLKI